MRKLPKFAQLQAQYLDYVRYTSPQVSTLIGGKVAVNNFPNTCAVRLSRMLNYTGFELPGPSSFSGGVVSGDDGKWYAFRVRDLRKWLMTKLGKPAVDHRKRQGKDFDKSSLSGMTGIIGFDIAFGDATGHLDLWNGSTFTSEKKGGLTTDYWKSATRIWVWPAG